MKSKIEEEQLLKMLADRDVKAMEFIYDNFSAGLYGFIRNTESDDQAAEEILKETFFRVWKNFSKYEPDKDRFFSWMIGICRGVCKERQASKNISGQNKNQGNEVHVSGNVSVRDVSFNPGSISINQIRNKLEPEYYRIIDLLYISGNSQSEVAEKLNIPLGTVKTRSHAAIQKLKTILLESGKQDEHK